MVQLAFTSILYVLVCSSLLSLISSQGLPVRTIYQGPPYQWFENLRTRHNGSIFVTEIDKPRLLEIDPFSGNGLQTVYEFSNYLGLLGITETEPDLFAVIVGNFSLATLNPGPGSYAVWKVDYRPKFCSRSGAPLVSKLADVPQAAFLNGMTYVPSAQAIFMADSQLGLIFKMNLHSGQYGVVVNNTLTQKCDPKAFEAINGLKYFNSSLYWTNSGCGFFAKMVFDRAGNPVGAASIVLNPNENMDDFDIGPDGTAYLAGGFANQIFKITPQGEFGTVAGNLNSSEIAEPTALAFGRTKVDKEKGTVYITTGGALGDPINGTVIVGAQILAIDLKSV